MQVSIGITDNSPSDLIGELEDEGQGTLQDLLQFSDSKAQYLNGSMSVNIKYISASMIEKQGEKAAPVSVYQH